MDSLQNHTQTDTMNARNCNHTKLFHQCVVVMKKNELSTTIYNRFLISNIIVKPYEGRMFDPKLSSSKYFDWWMFLVTSDHIFWRKLSISNVEWRYDVSILKIVLGIETRYVQIHWLSWFRIHFWMQFFYTIWVYMYVFCFWWKLIFCKNGVIAFQFWPLQLGDIAFQN